MNTEEQVVWADYLVIDERTLERKLKPDTPKEICEAYQAYLDAVQCSTKANKRIFK